MILWAGGKDISQLVDKITWNGDTKQVARTLSFGMVQKAEDKHMPKVLLSEGDEVILKNDEGGILFGGIIFDIGKSGSSGIITYLAYDLMFYINNSDITKVFSGTPEDITKEICQELDIPFGKAEPTKLSIYMPCLGKTAYQAIAMAYTAASKQNGKQYIPLIQNINQLFVLEKGKACGVTLSGDFNLTEASYQSTLQSLVNKVVITDKSGNIISTVNDANSQKRYGTVQKEYKAEDGKNAEAEAKLLFKTIEQSASVTALSDTRAVSGYSVMIKEPVSGLLGKFYIESDTHTFENGLAVMELTLAFQNMMDTEEMDGNT